MRLNISTTLALPADTVTSTLIVYGGKGTGKTNLGSVLAEELTGAGLRWSALDPLGVWWGVRHSRDGKGPGIECLILGGVHGDIPIEPTAGGVVADLVVEEGVNTVIDFSRKSNGEMWTKGERIRFVTDYAARLFQRQGEIRDGRKRPPFMQILDEGARYIPQVIPSGAKDLAACVGAWEQLVEEGRNVGIGVTLITQRSARMNKSVSELADAMISFRIVGPNSIEAVMDWLGEHVEKKRINEMIETLRRLPIGTALVVSPGWLDVERVVAIRERRTFDSSATPKPGEHRRQPAQAAKPDLAKYRERMAATIERAKQDDPRALRQELQAVRAQLAAAEKRPPPTPAAEPVRIPMITDEQLRRLETVAESLTDLNIGSAVDLLRDGARNLGEIASQITTAIHVAMADAGARQHDRGRGVDQRAPHAPPPTRAAAPKTCDRTNGGDHGELTSGQRHTLNVAAMLERRGIIANADVIAAWQGIHPNGGRYRGNLRMLRENGYLDDAYYPTPMGRAAAREICVGYDGVLGLLTEGQRQVVETVREHAPLTVEQLADAHGIHPNGGRFRGNIRRLRIMGVFAPRSELALTEAVYR